LTHGTRAQLIEAMARPYDDTEQAYARRHRATEDATIRTADTEGTPATGASGRRAVLAGDSVAAPLSTVTVSAPNITAQTPTDITRSAIGAGRISLTHPRSMEQRDQPERKGNETQRSHKRQQNRAQRGLAPEIREINGRRSDR
jgi:hypothetical protein